MTYAQIVQGICRSSGDDVAIDYDEKFRQWRQVAPGACPWNFKNAELFQDAIVKGLKAKPKYIFVNTALEIITDCTTKSKSGSTTSQAKPDQFDGTNEQSTFQNRTSISSIVTPIIANRLAEYLNGYDRVKAEFLIQGFSEGFIIPFQGHRLFRFSKNLSSLIHNDQQEISSGRVMGPFKDPPFENLQVSPLGLVPKKTPGEYRLIHHLSYPESSSINDGKPSEFCTVQYQSIQDAILAIQQVGVGALLAKTDLENAYKQVPIHPQSFELLGFQVNNEFYFDKTLPF